MTGVFLATGPTLPGGLNRSEWRGCVFILRAVFEPRNRVFSAASGHFYCYLAESDEIDSLVPAKSLLWCCKVEYERPAERSFHCEGGDPFGSRDALREGGDFFEADPS